MTTRTLMQSLFAEVSQTERSAMRHPRVQARRLGNCPPAEALLAVARHADRAEPQISRLARARRGTHPSAGRVVGSFFSMGRNAFADFFLTSEQSYRGTLLGIRHGLDVITLLRWAAAAEHDDEVIAWADLWLEERGPLVQRVAEQLRWFALHPERAQQNAKIAKRMS